MLTRITEDEHISTEDIDAHCDGCGAPWRKIEGIERGLTSTHPPDCPAILRMLPPSDRPTKYVA